MTTNSSAYFLARNRPVRDKILVAAAMLLGMLGPYSLPQPLFKATVPVPPHTPRKFQLTSGRPVDSLIWTWYQVIFRQYHQKLKTYIDGWEVQTGLLSSMVLSSSDGILMVDPQVAEEVFDRLLLPHQVIGRDTVDIAVRRSGTLDLYLYVGLYQRTKLKGLET